MPIDFAARYLAYLGGQVRVEPMEHGARITTPFLDRHNDQLTIYVFTMSDGLLLTDDGQTLDDRLMSGREVDSPELRETLAGFRVVERMGELWVQCKLTEFGEAFHRLLQAMWTLAWL